MDMKKGLMASALVTAALVSGQAAAGPDLAYVSTPIPAGTQTLVSVPVNNAVEVELTTETGTTGTTIKVPAASMAGGEYNAGANVKFYVRFIDGPAAGLWTSITANGTNSFTVDNADVVAKATSTGGDTIRVYAHHTVGSLFPADMLDDGDGGLLTTGVVGSGLQIQTISAGPGINKAQGTGTPGFVSFTVVPGVFAVWDIPDAPLLPETAFIISNAGTNDLVFIAPGHAPDHPVSILLPAATTQDTYVGAGYPVPMTVAETGVGTGSASRGILTRGTGVNAAIGDQIFGYLGFLGVWDQPNVELDPFGGFIVRQDDATDAGGIITVTKPY